MVFFTSLDTEIIVFAPGEKPLLLQTENSSSLHNPPLKFRKTVI